MNETNGIPIEVHDEHCPRCGETFPADTAELVDGKVYCSDCGFALAGHDPGGLRLAVQAVTFVEPRELTHVEKTLLWGLK